MTFLEAHRLVTSWSGGPSHRLRVALSGAAEPLALYLKAAGVKRSVEIDVSFLPFNTLQQHLLTEPDGTREVFLLLPWDLAPELDWRSGIPTGVDESGLLARARDLAALLRRRGAALVYLPAAAPPILADPARQRELQQELRAIAAAAGAVEVAAEVFSLSAYFGTGTPIAGASLGRVAEALVNQALRPTREPAKVLVTDLDNVVWNGVVAEDGLEGIHYGPHGTGYRHFAYQTLLARLKSEGVLLAAVSRNDPDTALLPFKSGAMTLKEDDFVSVIASYNAKSVQVAALAEQLNLGLDAFVFVDDNVLELAEMGTKLPAVRCEPFPLKDDDLPAALDRISGHFSRTVITEEDRERTALYRRRLAGMVPSDAQGADLRSFLEGLQMSLALHDRTSGDRTRAVQLINKTTQFNINGRRVSEEEVASIIAAGGRLLTATLNDRNGTHGEILAILLDQHDVVKSLVMSCRVFNRRAEFAFLAWLARGPRPPRKFEVAETPRNEPARKFFADAAFSGGEDGRLGFDALRFAGMHDEDVRLFTLVEP